MSGTHQHAKVVVPSKPGTYGLHLRLADSRRLQIGRLGEYIFPAGDYVYVGSALGPGGLQARTSRHLRADRSSHWHIDWLRPAVDIIGIWYQVTDKRLECIWSELLAAEPGATIPAPDFGASDCRSNGGRCKAHLISFNAVIAPEWMSETLTSDLPLPGSQMRYISFTSDSQLEGGDLE